MIRSDLRLSGFAWVDLIGPKKEDLTKISAEHGIPLRPLLNCLDPEHLPKMEILGDITFLILRTVDTKHKTGADSIEEITTKVAIFLSAKCVLTVHRLDPDFLSDIRARVSEHPDSVDRKDLLRGIFEGTIQSFDGALGELEKKAESFEQAIFQGRRSGRLLRQAYLLRRKASSCRKALNFTVDMMNRLGARPELAWNDFQDLRDTCGRLAFYYDELLENVTQLVNLHVALTSQKTNEASFRTNEIMRILTVFSIFFLPLNFIAGVYGMNFEFMPELKMHHGYFVVLAVMSAVALGIYLYMRRHGWLKPPNEEEAALSAKPRNGPTKSA